MNGLISTLPVSPPPGVGSVRSNSGSGVCPAVRWPGCPSALMVTLVTAPVGRIGFPDSSTSWNEPSTAEPVLVVGNCGPVSLTAPTNASAGIGLVPPGPVVSTVSVTWRPVSIATAELSVMNVDADEPLAASVLAPGVVPDPPRTIPGTHPAGTGVGVVAVQAAGRSMNALLPGPG